jgi:glycosyltransferase involved in cell wall biosynthesis
VLTVLHVAYPLAPVSLDATGGAEQVMALLDRALVARGHRSIAVACEASRTAGHLLAVPVEAAFDPESRVNARRAFRNCICQALDRWSIDIVHMHGVDFYEYLPPPGVPVLATLHLPPSFYPDSAFHPCRPATYLNCVSEAQRRACPPGVELAVVENGVPLDLFPDPPARRKNYALALGRICPEKGYHLALDAADRAAVPLWIAGAVFPYPEHQEYFRCELQPRLLPPHRYLGPADLPRKCELLRHARCLLISSLVPETSSLVAMEAMACGAPVISFPSGALPSVVSHERTGFLVRNVDEMAAAIGRAGEIDARECRREAEARFSAGRMADSYLELYQRLAGANAFTTCSTGQDQSSRTR